MGFIENILKVPKTMRIHSCLSQRPTSLSIDSRPRYSSSSPLGKNTAYFGLGGNLAERLGIKERSSLEVTRIPLTNSAASSENPLAMLERRDDEVMSHFGSILTKNGKRGDEILAQVNGQLSVKYGVPCPICIAVNAIRPIIKYSKSKVRRSYTPVALFPKTAEGIAMRWIVEIARGRTYVGGRPNIVRGLTDEIDAIIQGTSTLYAKRFQTHKNPN